MRRFWLWAENLSLTVMRKILVWRARDITADLATGSCLVLAPHADDETLGCGGLIQRKRAHGAQVAIVVATDGAASHSDEPARVMTPEKLVALRRKETLAACAKLGVAPSQVGFFDLPDGRLGEVQADLETAISQAVARHAPAEVYVCALADGHRDHVALSLAARAVRARGELGGAALFEYPVWFWDFRSWRVPGRSNKAGFVLGLRQMLRTVRGVRLRRVALAPYGEIKRAALEEHRSQLGLLPEEPAWSGLPAAFLAHFFDRYELFFELAPDPVREGEDSQR